MFDLGLTKMALIGVVALIVLGPKRLPGVARTAGVLFGRAQRYVDDIKAEFAREIELDGLKTMRAGFETAALNVENTVQDVLRSRESELDDARKSGNSVLDSGASVEGPGLTCVDREASGVVTDISQTSQRKRRNWRVKKHAIPTWYKHATVRKPRLQSRASQAAWWTPEVPAAINRTRPF
jgi:sec-independent protein translocase protein TatB